MFHGIQLHLIGKGPFAWKKAFSLQVAVNHNNCGGIIIQITDNDRHSLLFCQFTGSVPPVSGYQLITALRVRPGNRRNQNTILLDTVSGLHHGFVILDFEWVILKRMQFRQWNFLNLFQLCILATFFGGEQIIYRGQLYFFRAAFQVSTPPSSDFCSPLPPCHQDHGQKCFFPRR